MREILYDLDCNSAWFLLRHYFWLPPLESDEAVHAGATDLQGMPGLRKTDLLLHRAHDSAERTGSTPDEGDRRPSNRDCYVNECRWLSHPAPEQIERCCLSTEWSGLKRLKLRIVWPKRFRPDTGLFTARCS